ncbi:hypothetical protein MHU86_11529 [Fragilaria crotonensis]|nr:hypothetical protein MHU86_11529 [Fragilaria crotonensis]
MVSSSTIHDLLSIGEIEAALASNEDTEAEIDRLPLLLRLLATGQPLSAVPHLMPHSQMLSTDQTSDPFVNAVVSKLEDVAATHSAAESIDVLVNHLAPSISRRISRLQPLKRKPPDRWSTSELAATALAPLSHLRSKKSRLHPVQRDSMYSHESDDNLEEASCDEMEDVSGNVKMQDTPAEVVLLSSYEGLKRRRSEGGRESFLAGMPEDSADAHLTRVLSEVASLVVESLQPPISAPKEEQEETPTERILSVKADSLLSESDTTMSGGNDLAACLSALMHHAPVLRHRHVASAFCRASVPQASTLIYLMGANSPSAVACLVRGCMDAVSTEGATESTITIAKEAVRRLAKLSQREAARIQGMLQSDMLDVQLELALEHDTVAAACLLIRFLGKGESLRCLLHANSSLVSKCYSCLLSQIEASEKNSGEMKMLLRALTWLIRSVVVAKTKVLSTAATTLASTLMKYSCNDQIESKQQTSCCDPAILLALSSSLLLCSVLALNGGQGVEDEVKRKDAWQNLLKSLLVSFNPPSVTADVLLSRIAVLLHSQEINLLHELVQEALSSQDRNADDDLQDGFLKLCKWAVVKGNLDTVSNRTLTPTAVALDPSALLQMIAANYLEVAKLRCLMQDILSSAIAGSTLVRHIRVNDLLTAAINFISRSDKQDVPLVSQTMLSSLIRKATSKVGGEASTTSVLHMALNFAYAVIFFDENPTSPFSVDLRDQPVGVVLQLMKELNLGFVYKHIASILHKHVPEIMQESEFVNPSMTTVLEVSNESSLNDKDITRLLSAALREALRRPDADPSGLRVERTFLLAQRHLPSFEVDCLVVRNLMSLPNSPAPFLTYGMLCRDPLLVLQFPLSIWQCRGIRRVALSILGRLLPANENLARQASPSEEVAEEFITSRNVVVLRCLLSLATGHTLSDDANSSFRLTKPCQCHVLTGTIRSLVASHSGLVAILIKHGLPDEVVDWLVDCVPECINDAFALTMLLSERCPLTAAERLKTADAALRIAIAFGSRDELAAKNLVGACLHQLITSFYLVLGPVGVPVNALIEESGMDLTQVCRKATFRILNALQKVRASRTGLKSECSLALQKLASLCKGETGMTGVAGAVANRRKALLKEIWDALVKALNGMGSGISLN